MPEGLLLVVWSSIGLWAVGWVGCGSKVFTLRWAGLGWVEEIGPTDNSVLHNEKICCPDGRHWMHFVQFYDHVWISCVDDDRNY